MAWSWLEEQLFADAKKIQGRDVTASAPSDGQVLTWDTALATIKWATPSGGGGTSFPSGLTVGSTPALTGGIRMGHAQTIKGRNLANSADRSLVDWGVAANDTLTLGDSAAFTNIRGSFLFVTGTIAYGTSPAQSGTWRVPHAFTFSGRNNANAADRSLLDWGTTTDTLTLGDTAAALKINASTLTIDPNTIVVHKAGASAFVATTGEFRLGHSPWAMVARNSTDATNQNIIRSNPTANSLILGDTAGWGAVTLQAPSLSVVTGGSSFGVGSTGLTLTGSTALTSQFFWASTAVTPLVAITQQADANPGEPLTLRAQQGGSTGNQNGGQLRLQGGAQSGTGLKGGVSLALNGTTETMVELAELATGRRVLALCRGSDITTTQMPASTGDAVIYIANAAVVPSANAVGGGILYCEAGALKFRGSGGTITTIAAA